MLEYVPRSLKGNSSRDSHMLQIRPAGLKGLGVFATTHIPRGTRVFAEPAVFGIRNEESSHIFPAFQALSERRRAKVLALSQNSTTSLSLIRWLHVLYYTAATRSLPTLDNLRTHKLLLDIFRSNAFSLNRSSKYAQAIFPSIARLNHDCIPNAQANFNDSADALHVHTLRDIKPEEEICLSYLDDSGDMSTQERNDSLNPYGFACACPICSQGSKLATQSSGRRQRIQALLNSLGEDHAVANLRGRRDLLLQIIGVMKQEGLVGRELSARYSVASAWSSELGDLEAALDYALKGLEIDEYCLGRDHSTYAANEAQVNIYRQKMRERQAGPTGDLSAPIAASA